jgi:DNA polymerase (family X)
MTNLEIAKLLRNMAAAYQILNENRFKIIAYERAADSIEHLTSEVKDLWDDKKLSEISGVGPTIAQHLDELMRTGHVKHIESVLIKLPESVYPLLLVPGIGPKKAYKLVKELKLTSAATVFDDLKKAALADKISPLENFGEKSQADILKNLDLYKQGQIKENRMPLPDADHIAQEIMEFLRKLPEVKRVDTLGSLRRQVSTIGDIDLSIATDSPKKVIEYFVTFSHKKLIEQGPTGASLLLHNGRQVDLRVQTPEAYGAMLQYFTGSKNHNITLRSYALTKGLSLNEYGIKDTTTQKTKNYATEEAFYGALKLDWIPPEIREDKGEVEAARAGKLPMLVETSDIIGDLHVHTSYNLEPSHDLGANSLEEHLDKAQKLGYAYLGISDHNPSVGNHTETQIVDIMKRRQEYYQKHHAKWIEKTKKNARLHRQVQLFVMCEVDILPDGRLALPEKAFDYVDAVIASIHSSFAQNRTDMTKRVVTAISANPKVRIFGHPTTRLLGKREGVEFDWNRIFEICKRFDIALEINAYPLRLDLPDSIVFDAKKRGVRFCINTDSHAVDQMGIICYGVSVARRGWATKYDIVNTMEYNEFRKWLVK